MSSGLSQIARAGANDNLLVGHIFDQNKEF